MLFHTLRYSTITSLLVLILLGLQPAPTYAQEPYQPRALTCSINTACQVDEWNEAISATVKIIFDNGDTCTGVMINNTRQDRRPLILTANHCGAPTVGDTVNWTFQFNYESPSCADPLIEPVAHLTSGATVLAAQGGSFDFTLLELASPLPESLPVSYAGWSLDDTAASSGTVIGHPRGDLKKITYDDDPLTSYGTIYWQGIFDRGSIEDNSSGSPLFNQHQQVIGVLKAARHLNVDACSGPGGDDNEAKIVFTKLSYLWSIGLGDHLDPDGTEITSMAGLSFGSADIQEPDELAVDSHRTDLELSLGVSNASPSPGDLVAYRFKLVNNGTTSATNIEVTSDLASCLDIKSIRFSRRDNTYDEATKRWYLGSLNPGERAKLKITVRTDRCLGEATSSASVTAFQMEGQAYTFEHHADAGVTKVIHVQTASQGRSQEVAQEEINPVTLLPGYPNPFNPETVIPFELMQSSYVKVEVYDLLGRQVQVLVNEHLSAGSHEVNFRAAGLPTGVYLVRVESQGHVQTQRITLMK